MYSGMATIPVNVTTSSNIPSWALCKWAKALQNTAIRGQVWPLLVSSAVRRRGTQAGPRFLHASHPKVAMRHGKERI